MSNRRAMQIFSPKDIVTDYAPSKSDLHKVLDNLRFKEPLKTSRARAALGKATKARRMFEQGNEIWLKLRRAEKLAGLRLQKIADLERERQKDEIAECRTMLRLHGVTPIIIERIERLVYGAEE